MPMSTEQSLDALVKVENQKLKVLTEIRMTLNSILEKMPGEDFLEIKSIDGEIAIVDTTDRTGSIPFINGYCEDSKIHYRGGSEE